MYQVYKCWPIYDNRDALVGSHCEAASPVYSLRPTAVGFANQLNAKEEEQSEVRYEVREIKPGLLNGG